MEVAKLEFKCVGCGHLRHVTVPYETETELREDADELAKTLCLTCEMKRYAN